MVSTKSPSVEGDVDQITAYFMACTLEEEDGCAMGYKSLMFGTLIEGYKDTKRRLQEATLNKAACNNKQ